MTKTTILLAGVAAVVATVVLVRTARAQSLPAYRAQDPVDEEHVAKYVDSFLRADAQTRQLLNRSNLQLFAEGYRPRIGVPHDPEAETKVSDLQTYFARKVYLDLRALSPFKEQTFRDFLDGIADDSGETIMCAGDLAEKYHLNVQGRFVFEKELAKVPAGANRERLKECWLNDAVLGAEFRIVAWIYGEIFGKDYLPAGGTSPADAKR